MIALRRPTNLGLIGLVVAGRLVDVTMSVVAFSHGAAEANPVSRLAYAVHGMGGLVAQQALGVVLIMLIFQALLGPYKRRGWLVCVVVSWIPPTLNALIITGLVRP